MLLTFAVRPYCDSEVRGSCSSSLPLLRSCYSFSLQLLGSRLQLLSAAPGRPASSGSRRLACCHPLGCGHINKVPYFHRVQLISSPEVAEAISGFHVVMSYLATPLLLPASILIPQGGCSACAVPGCRAACGGLWGGGPSSAPPHPAASRPPGPPTVQPLLGPSTPCGPRWPAAHALPMQGRMRRGWPSSCFHGSCWGGCSPR